MLLFGVLTICMLPIVINTVIVFSNQVKWSLGQIKSYSIELGYYGLGGGQPLQTVVVEDGQFLQSIISFERDGKTVTIVDYDGSGFLDLTIDELFSEAYGCFIYTFCRVQFDEIYGYPKSIGGGFLESGWIISRNLEPTTN